MVSKNKGSGTERVGATSLAARPVGFHLHRENIVFRIVIVLVLFGIATAGCSSGDELKIAAVDGVVKFNGEPVQYANVVFVPLTDTGGQSSFGQTDADGRFAKIVMPKTGRKGAVVGKYSVCVTEGWPPNASIPLDKNGLPKSPPRGNWPDKYRESAGSPLQVEVAARGGNHFEFSLTE